MLKSIQNLIKHNSFLRPFLLRIYYIYKYASFKRKNSIFNKGKGKLKIKIWGVNNEIKIEEGCFFKNVVINIIGNNNKLILENKVRIGSNSQILIGGKNIQVHIKEGTSSTENLQINAVEDDRKIIIGNNCMISNNVMIRTSDGHSIFDSLSNIRINNPQDVMIGNNVWIGSKSDIMKGAVIPDGCIVGSHTSVTKKFDKMNCLIIGRPGIIKKENVYWKY